MDRAIEHLYRLLPFRCLIETGCCDKCKCLLKVKVEVGEEKVGDHFISLFSAWDNLDSHIAQQI